MKLFFVLGAALLLTAPAFALEAQPQLVNATYKPKRAKTHRTRKHKSVRRVSRTA